ncbi:MAG: hypothetical protein R2932_18475 [Caldilineaceae bacterium]
MYLFGRVLRLGRLPAFFSGVVFMFSGFLIVSVVFTMFLAAVVWLPLLLAIVEQIIHKQEEKGTASFHPIPYLIAGIITLTLIILAGHPELIYYTALVTGLYTVVRLIAAWRVIGGSGQLSVSSNQLSGSGTVDSGQETDNGKLENDNRGHVSPFDNAQGKRITSRLLKLTGWLLVMALLGVAAGAVQLVPLLELVPLNFREGSASLQQILDWAWPSRHILTFFLPDIYGNPSHHAWFDLWQWRWTPATVNALGEPVNTIFWGIKNYVEGGNYLGLATWLLAAIATINTSRITHHASRNTHRLFFLALAILSLLFAFGTPLYGILYYGLPGWSQLHSPFRWVFPFTLSMAMLAGIGLQDLLETRRQGEARLEIRETRQRRARTSRFTHHALRITYHVLRLIPLAVIIAGLGALILVGVSYFVPTPFITFGERVLAWSDLARMGFADGRMFWGYQAGNLVKFGGFAVAAGTCVWWLVHNSDKRTRGQGVKMISRDRPVIQSSGHLVIGLLIAITILDLYAAHGHFNPAVDPTLSPRNPANIPPVVQFINEREEFPQSSDDPISQAPISPWRFTTFDRPGAKTFNANVGMYYGWQDIRGYDSIIPRQYVEFMDRIAPQEGELLYNRIAPLYAHLGVNSFADTLAMLDNPLLDLLNVKYILTESVIADESWKRIYWDGTVRVYENQEVMPRPLLCPKRG